MNEKNNKVTPIVETSFQSLGIIVFLILLVLKIANVADIPWFWVFFPLWIPFAILLGIAVLTGFILLFILIFTHDEEY